MIQLEDISKSFRVAQRGAGLGKAVKALFSREYTVVQALNHVSFTIGEGEMVGYIGPNGAGKSSTIKIMSGILTPDSGTCTVNGLTPWLNRKQHVQHIGVVFGQRSQLWWDVPVADSFELLRDIYRVDEATYRRNRDELVEGLALGDVIRTPARQLSLGQRMRCEIVASLLHSPGVLFLDEPTIGLDAVSKIAVREFIKRLNREKGTTVILTTHDMQDIEALTRRILLIGKGRILLDGTLAELKRRKGQSKTLVVEYTGSSTPACCEGLRIVSAQPGRAQLEVDTAVLAVSDAIGRLAAELEITDLAVEDTSAEQLVVSLYEEFHI